jgi:hypothetical protein
VRLNGFDCIQKSVRTTYLCKKKKKKKNCYSWQSFLCKDNKLQNPRTDLSKTIRWAYCIFFTTVLTRCGTLSTKVLEITLLFCAINFRCSLMKKLGLCVNKVKRRKRSRKVQISCTRRKTELTFKSCVLIDFENSISQELVVMLQEMCQLSNNMSLLIAHDALFLLGNSLVIRKSFCTSRDSPCYLSNLLAEYNDVI